MPVKVGDLRPSQIIFTYGVGSTVELPHITGMVMGLDEWWKHRPPVEISEVRVLDAVRELLGEQVQKLCTPPIALESGINGNIDDSNRIGVPIATFPTWLRCPSCDKLGKVGSGLFTLKANPFRPDRTRYVHTNCPKATDPVSVPARFLVACENGHLDDFPWISYVHKGKDCVSPSLKLQESGISGTAADVWVKCDTCGEARPMSNAFDIEQREEIQSCSGRRPHLRDFAPAAAGNNQACDQSMKAILLGASNSWFPLSVSALFIPTATDELAKAIEADWQMLQHASSKEVVIGFHNSGALPSAGRFNVNDIWSEVQKRRSKEQESEDKSKDLKLAEWRVLSQPDPSLNTDDFDLQEVAPPEAYCHLINKVVLVTRLREVRALVGFTRIESPGDFGDTLEIPKERRVPISRTPPSYVPASEVRGEGLFLRFNETELSQWEKSSAVMKWTQDFRTAYKAWRASRGLDTSDGSFPGARFFLIHSFSHALMRQFALECGYAAASIRERLYSKDAFHDDGPMAGLLLYTAAPDSEGTLGGLVRLGQPDTLGRHIQQALEHVRLCASDPLCAEHHPTKDGISLHGAACHGCLFAPETSCERGNRFLDRNVLLRTIKNDRVAFCD